MRIIKKGLFYRILDSNLISTRRFLSKQSAIEYYYNHQNRDGFPVKEVKCRK